MTLICPSCLSESTALPRCPACHASLPNTQESGDWQPPGWTARARLRSDAGGVWLSCVRGEERGLVWGSSPGAVAELPSVPEKSWGVRPLAQGMDHDRVWCVWPWPAATLPAVSPMGPRDALEAWSDLHGAGAFSQYRELFPWELVRVGGGWRMLQGRPTPAGLPLPGTIFAPERLLSPAGGEKSAVFNAAAWYLFATSGAYPVGLPTPVSWRRLNLERVDVAVFEGLRAEPSARPSLEEFSGRLAEAVAGPSVAAWVVNGLLYAAGAAFLLAWAGGALWVVTRFDLL